MASARFLWIGVALLLVLHPREAAAVGGCHTDCAISWGPCLSCGFRAVSNVLCYRSSCDACDTLSCDAALPAQGDRWAADFARPEVCPASPVSRMRIVRVQRLAARG